SLPQVLDCFHTFCQPCLEKVQVVADKITCPECHAVTTLTSHGVYALMSDIAVSSILESHAVEANTNLGCTGCKSKESNAVARCFDCANFLCPNCVMAHQFMHCFEGHRVMTLGELQSGRDGGGVGGDPRAEKPVACPRHKHDALAFFCRTCDVPICGECASLDHSKAALHDYEPLAAVESPLVIDVTQIVDDGKMKTKELKMALKTVEHTGNRLQIQYTKAQTEIADTYNFYRSMIEERKQETLKELEAVYTAKNQSLTAVTARIEETIARLHNGCDFIERLLKHASKTEVLLYKKGLEARLHGALDYMPDVSNQNTYDFEFVSNYQAIQIGVRNTYGYIRQSTDFTPPTNPVRQAPIARPSAHALNGMGGGGGGPNSLVNGISSIPNGLTMSSGVMNGHARGVNGHVVVATVNGHGGGHHHMNNMLFEPPATLLSKRFSSSNGSLSSYPAANDLYEKWSSGGMDIFAAAPDPFPQQQQGGMPPPPVSQHQQQQHHHHDAVGLELASKLITTNIFPPKCQIRRQKMIYHCKFGEFGVMEGQFTEPSGVAVNAQNDIIVADTNNHRIQIFDREGRFKFQFGECGKRDGQLLYPNRVAVIRTSGDIIVTERSPTHQIQIYNQYGQFVRKFGANILQHPRGVTVDNKGRIVVVECKVMRVIIFSQCGEVLQKFGCSKHLEFPNGVVVNDKQEIFISDNRAHCVKVFSYEGVYLRQIGGEGVTNYPIGVGVNHVGEILIADNHNNFNITIFKQDGQLVNALESKVKHAQCFDVALMDDGSVVLASKDYRLYIYRYIQVPSIGL
ncbi:PREDICTED: brain tumor protein-like, partial [Priapulus caudatus]|uniref:Brain tumor protein-like n=1 Tax=Priapulus caudatus TaxID=37621 RepID=A0ABM1F1I1_PRICU